MSRLIFIGMVSGVILNLFSKRFAAMYTHVRLYKSKWNILLMQLLFIFAIAVPLYAADNRLIGEPASILPQDWLPISLLGENSPDWFTYKKSPPSGPQLYIPEKAKQVRGVFVCYIFHSQDPRELARLWDFALLAIPPQCEFDIGFYDKRNTRGAGGKAVGNMGNVLTYLDIAAKELKRPELATVPLVGWVGQNGGPIAADLYKRAPERLLAWTDSWDWSKYELSKVIPVANAWELNEGARTPLIAKIAGLAGKPTPPTCMAATATTYGSKHGIFSKFGYFAAWLDRCIQLRMPEELPEPGKRVVLKLLKLEDGWAGDFAPMGSWNPIAPVKEAKGFALPIWFPDEYTAWMWRSYHSDASDIKITAPSVPYGQNGFGSGGIGYGRAMKVGSTATFTAAVTGPYIKVEFYDGNIKLAEVSAAPWSTQAKLEHRGVRAFHAIGIRSDGTKAASQCALTTVE